MIVGGHHPDVEEAHVELPPTPAAVGVARVLVRCLCAEWGADDVSDVAQLLTSELVTNAVVHAQAAPAVTVRLLADRVHVEVSDSTDSEPDAVRPGVLDEISIGGRGLAMVEALSMSWGSVPMAGGKVVWFDVARPGHDGPPQHGE